MFKFFSIRLKLVLAFMLVAILFVFACVYQIWLSQQFNQQLNQLTSQNVARQDAIASITTASQLLKERQDSYQSAMAKTPTVANREKQALLTQTQDLAQQTERYKNISDDSQSSIATTIASSANILISVTQATLASNKGFLVSDRQKLHDAQFALVKATNLAVATEHRAIQDKTASLTRQISNNQFIIGAAAIIFILISTAVGAIVANRISRSIATLGAGAERIANGDFSQELKASSRDEIGQVALVFNRMAQRLRESYRRIALEQQRDEAILKGMGEGIIATNEHGKIVIINKVATDLLELGDESTVINKSIQDAYTLYDLSKMKDTKLPNDERPSFRALSTGQPVEDVYGFHTKHGAKRQLNIAANPFLLDGKVVGVITILRDVTKEKEVDRMKTEFISLASHQLRTPLSAIKWFTEMLLNGDAGKLNADQLEFMNNVSESTERMIALVASLLNISRIESGRIMIVPEPTDLEELVGGIVNDLKAKTEEKKQTLIISVHADLPKINLDPRMIGQVYLNLLTNAIKYTQEGGEISVFISKKDDMIISQVTDNGYGIPKEQQDRMFQKFFRAANAVKVETDGTGLGLYLIKAIIESSGGKIWFKSEENKGTTFWFSMPMSGMVAKEGEVTLDM